MKLAAVSIFLLMTATLVLAQESLPDLMAPTSAGGKQWLQGVRLIKVEPDGLRVMHTKGTAKVPFAMLPTELQRRYAYNPAMAKPVHATAAEPATAGAPAASTTVAPPVSVAASPSTSPRPATTHVFLTMQSIKESSLAQCNPNLVTALDRNVLRRRWVLERKAARIRMGLLDPHFLYQAHLKNSEAYRAAGDAVRASDELKAAMSLHPAAMQAANMEAIAYEADLSHAKTTSQAPGIGGF